MNKTLLLNLFLCSFLAACGGGGGGSSSSENSGSITDNTGENTDNNGSDTDTAPTVSLEKPWAEDGSTILSAKESLVFNFSEPMQTNTLTLSGNMQPDCGDETDSLACLDLAWNQDTTQLIVTPKDGFYWYANTGTLEMAITGDGELGLNTTMSATVLPVFENHQAADVVIGQETFTSKSAGVSDTALFFPTSINLIETPEATSILITDNFNNRIVKYETIPTSNNTPHSAIFGQKNSESSETGYSKNRLISPRSAKYLDGRIYVLDSHNKRAVWLTEDNFIANGEATSLVGKDDFSTSSDDSCSANRLGFGTGMEVVRNNNDTYWLISEYYKSRVMVWKNPSDNLGESASFVLGQDDFYTCLKKNISSEGLNSIVVPSGIWSNGDKLIITDIKSNRLLVWNDFPMESGDTADFQLGQDNEFSSHVNANKEFINQRGLQYPTGIGGNDHQICVADTNNNRVVIWESLPEHSEDLPSIVIGQKDFNTLSDAYFPSSQSLINPYACDISLEQLFIVDSGNHRVLIYNALNKRP